MTFTHLHVASGYSMQYGASSPADLVARAGELELESLALTDRDGLYGAVKFVTECTRAGITPLLGVDLAVAPTGLLRGLPGWADPAAEAAHRQAGGTPVRGGGVVDPRHSRVTVLAHSGARVDAGLAGPGWSQLCRLVSATHLHGERSAPVSTVETIGAHAQGPAGADLEDPGALSVLLGPGSELGRALLARRPDLARAVLARWYDAMPLGAVAVEVVCHDGPDDTPASLGHAARLLGFAEEVGIPAVLTGAVRFARPDGAVVADLLDATRRLVPLGTRHLDRTTSAGHLCGAQEMTRIAQRVADAAGLGRSGATRLLTGTQELAARCRLNPGRDLGIGQVHLPEPSLVTRGRATTHHEAEAVLRQRCEAGIGRRYPGASQELTRTVQERLESELRTINSLGYPTYFLTVAEVCDLIRERGVRVAARGSGAGSLVNHLLGISGVEPIGLGLLMERFCTPLRAELPDIDIDVESARRTEIYQWILDRFGGERVNCVSMMDTYRVRHAVRDVGAALSLPPNEIDAIATAFPHISARHVRSALAELPELARSGLTSDRYRTLFDLVERLDGLPRHIAVHPCGVLLSNDTLLDRTPVEASWQGFPMSQFDKDDVEVLGLLKLDVLGIRMQSAMAYALDEIERVDGPQTAGRGGHPPDAGYLDPQTGRIDLDAVPFGDDDTFRLIRSTRTLGCFQIESPGQRELIGKFAPQEFSDLVIDISLFRPGPVKSDMIVPFLSARQGWTTPQYLHPTLEPVLAETGGVVVYHEHVMGIVSVVTGVDLAEADDVRRRMGRKEEQDKVEVWFRERALSRGYTEADLTRIWEVLKSFASFGFCKAHAAAFALPTYQSAWLKAHHPAAFLAGVLTHDPGMYPKRLILDDARNLGITVLGLDVNASGATYRVERLGTEEQAPHEWGSRRPGREVPGSGGPPNPLAPVDLRYDAWVPDAGDYGIRVALTDVKGISDAEVERIVAGQPYRSLSDLWFRAAPSRPIAERLVLAGGLDALYAITGAVPVPARDRVTRRDLLLQVADLDRWSRSLTPKNGRRGRNRPGAVTAGGSVAGDGVVHLDPRAAAAGQSQAAAQVVATADLDVQLALDLGDAPEQAVRSGLPDMTAAERVRSELDILGLDASSHLIRFYLPMLRDLGVTPAADLLNRRSRQEILVAGVKVATQTPPIRSGRRVVFLTLDDSTGPVDATFFEDVQGPYASTVFGSWLLLVRGLVRRTGPRGISLRATGAWELSALWQVWTQGGARAVADLIAADGPAVEDGFSRRAPARVTGTERDDGDALREGRTRGPVDAQGPEAERSRAAAVRRTLAARAGDPPAAPDGPAPGPGTVPDPALVPARVCGPGRAPDPATAPAAHLADGQPDGQVRRRRVLVHASGYRQSPYADLRPPGVDTRATRRQAELLSGAPPGDDMPHSEVEPAARRQSARRLWHASPGSSGW